jgi:hypothetical protein
VGWDRSCRGLKESERVSGYLIADANCSLLFPPVPACCIVVVVVVVVVVAVV